MTKSEYIEWLEKKRDSLPDNAAFFNARILIDLAIIKARRIEPEYIMPHAVSQSEVPRGLRGQPAPITETTAGTKTAYRILTGNTSDPDLSELKRLSDAIKKGVRCGEIGTTTGNVEGVK